jgi:hypothetical protein
VGHVIIESKAGEILYDDCPTESTRKLTWLDFPGAAKLWEGGLMQVNYGLPGCSGSGHGCNRATFEWGSYEDTANPLGVAYLDNAGGPNDRGNVCDGAALTVWRSIVQGGVPNTPYIKVSPGWETIWYTGVGDKNLPDYVVGPYNKDYWVFSGDLEVDDDLVIDGQRVFADDTAGPIVWGSNVFLKFLRSGQTLTLNVWNSGSSTGQNPGGGLYLYPSGSDGSSSNLSRCNAFIIPPNTIGAIQARLPVAGQRKVCYRRAGVPAMAACPDALRVPTGYKPKITGVSVLPSAPFTATASFTGTMGLPGQVPIAKRALLTAAERWDVEISRNGWGDDYFSLVFFFPSEGYQGGMIEVGAAIDSADSYASEVVRVGQNATLRISHTYYEYSGDEPVARPLDLDIRVDMVFIPV